MNEWLLGSDFNEIQCPKDREGREEFNQQGAGEFNYVVQGLLELEPIGRRFTLSNGVGSLHTSSRLDMPFGYLEWVE